ncbi:MAG: hypothetical protein LBT99_03060 [Bifidobacteriaceae bacterium]|jgi:hypothetical protein|nr:hypothetical protein [Bifidobacteriaceae bacterium]
MIIIIKSLFILLGLICLVLGTVKLVKAIKNLFKNFANNFAKFNFDFGQNDNLEGNLNIVNNIDYELAVDKNFKDILKSYINVKKFKRNKVKLRQKRLAEIYTKW